MSWRMEEETRGAMAVSEQETILVWVSQTMESARTNEESVSVLRHSTGKTPVAQVRLTGKAVFQGGARVRHDWWYAKISLAGLIS